MSKPVLELIAENILTTVNAITVAAGFNQTLTASRTQPVEWETFSPADLQVLMEQDEIPDELPDQVCGYCDIEQSFYLTAYVLVNDSTSGSIDTRRNQIWADIKKALRADPKRGTYAINTRIKPQVNFKEENGRYAGVITEVIVHYRTLENDPYSLG